MRFKVLPIAFRAAVIMYVYWFAAGLIGCLLLINKDYCPEGLSIAVRLHGLLLGALLIVSPVACRQIEVSEKGVASCFLFFRWSKIPWDEVSEIGYLYTITTKFTWKYIYISRRSLSPEEIKTKGILIWDTDLIAAQCSEELMTAIRKYTNLDEKGKFVVL